MSEQANNSKMAGHVDHMHEEAEDPPGQERTAAALLKGIHSQIELGLS